MRVTNCPEEIFGLSKKYYLNEDGKKRKKHQSCFEAQTLKFTSFKWLLPKQASDKHFILKLCSLSKLGNKLTRAQKFLLEKYKSFFVKKIQVPVKANCGIMLLDKKRVNNVDCHNTTLSVTTRNRFLFENKTFDVNKDDMLMNLAERQRKNVSDMSRDCSFIITSQYVKLTYATQLSRIKPSKLSYVVVQVLLELVNDLKWREKCESVIYVDQDFLINLHIFVKGYNIRATMKTLELHPNKNMCNNNINTCFLQETIAEYFKRKLDILESFAGKEYSKLCKKEGIVECCSKDISELLRLRAIPSEQDGFWTHDNILRNYALIEICVGSTGPKKMLLKTCPPAFRLKIMSKLYEFRKCYKEILFNPSKNIPTWLILLSSVIKESVVLSQYVELNLDKIAKTSKLGLSTPKYKDYALILNDLIAKAQEPILCIVKPKKLIRKKVVTSRKSNRSCSAAFKAAFKSQVQQAVAVGEMKNITVMQDLNKTEFILLFGKSAADLKRLNISTATSKLSIPDFVRRLLNECLVVQLDFTRSMEKMSYLSDKLKLWKLYYGFCKTGSVFFELQVPRFAKLDASETTDVTQVLLAESALDKSVETQFKVLKTRVNKTSIVQKSKQILERGNFILLGSLTRTMTSFDDQLKENSRPIFIGNMVNMKSMKHRFNMKIERNQMEIEDNVCKTIRDLNLPDNRRLLKKLKLKCCKKYTSYFSDSLPHRFEVKKKVLMTSNLRKASYMLSKGSHNKKLLQF